MQPHYSILPLSTAIFCGISKKKFFLLLLPTQRAFLSFKTMKLFSACGLPWAASGGRASKPVRRRRRPGSFQGRSPIQLIQTYCLGDERLSATSWRHPGDILATSRRHTGDILATSWRHSDAETSPDAPGRVLETFLRSRHRNHSPENGIDRERSGAEWTRHSLKRRHQGNSSRQSAGADFRRLLPGIRLSKRTPYAPLTSNEVADTPAWT